MTTQPDSQPTGAAPESHGRLELWKKKLLDLSMRNRLLNYRDTKKSLPLVCPHIAEIEDALASGSKFTVEPLARLRLLQAPGEPRAERSDDGALGVDVQADLRRKILRSSLRDAKDLDARLLAIYRAARVALEEGGASGLYLALGFLRYYQSESSDQPRRAPILLLPISLVRPSVQTGFRVLLSDEDSRINVSLLEYLRHDHGIEIKDLDPLPEDESGVDVPKVLETIRRATSRHPTWQVEEGAAIGLFAFKKFLMWRDLDQHSELLLQSSLVSHLVQRPNEQFESDATFPDPSELDERIDPTELFCPLDADSSQLAAVVAASEGRTFVLKGPPGTGKSQTIANMISHCLATGKTVLFVAEKRAALEVVYRRLQERGLSDFALELHSDKAQKREVIQSIAATLELVENQDTRQWESDGAASARLRCQLNDYVRALHRRWSDGFTAYQMISRLVALRDVPALPLEPSADQPLDQATLDQIEELVHRLTAAQRQCGDLQQHPWTGVPRETWSEAWGTEIRSALTAAQQTTSDLVPPLARFCELLDLDPEALLLQHLPELGRLAELLASAPGTPPTLLLAYDWQGLKTTLLSWLAHGRRRDQLRAELFARFEPKVLALDLDQLTGLLTEASSDWFLPRWWKRRAVLKTLRTAARSPLEVRVEHLREVIDTAKALRDEQALLDLASDRAREVLGDLWRGGEADWGHLGNVIGWTEEVRAIATKLSHGEPSRLDKLREHWSKLGTTAPELFAAGTPGARSLADLRASLARFRETLHSVLSQLGFDPDDPDTHPAATTNAWVSTLSNWIEHFPRLREWCHWRARRAEAVARDLGPLVRALESGALSDAEPLQVFHRSYAEWWYRTACDREPVLGSFHRGEHEEAIERFRDIDRRFTDLTARVVRSRLAARLPRRSSHEIKGSELGILRREASKKRRHKPLRLLFQEIPALLTRLKPCFLMSPVSVAQYLGPEAGQFDLVIFDEASQIPVWDAIGAVARGDQAVVVGDPKQLPPTNFFNVDLDEEYVEEDAVEDLESVLDDCIAGGVEPLDLRWHYRSQHENLIAFSNESYYDRRLFTFPSVDSARAGIFWHAVDGEYDKGHSRTNRPEAEQLVAALVERLRSPEAASTSYGVVTFSQAQQVLIEDLLEQARRAHPEIDPAFTSGLEPVFVKNLENVQGDERDVILFSICYGPDRDGRVSMNFGPLNKQGGERRLNVAVTRARREVHVFSSLRADQIDLSRTKARGVADLRAYLDFAERGPTALSGMGTPTGADPESPFEEDVLAAVKDLGWKAVPQVGCSDYRIDIAVLDPEAPGRYLLGIECDGANYHSAATARDRDRIREAVLRSLGWRLHRIWSTDWWRDRAHEMSRLQEALESARSAPKGQHRQSERPRPQPPSSPPPPPQREPASAPDDDAGRPQTPAEVASGSEPYRAFQSRRLGGPDDFWGPRAAPAIRKAIQEAIAIEGPIASDLLVRRVAASWGFARAGSRIRGHIEAHLRHVNALRTRSNDTVFFWPIEFKEKPYEVYRVPPTGQTSERGAEEIPPEEIANAAASLLESHISIPLPDLARETARVLGFHRLGSKVDAAMQRGIEHLAKGDRATIEGGVVRHIGS
jgi:very-short-patch-repair endonuclease